MSTSARAAGTYVFTKPSGEIVFALREGQAPPLRYDEGSRARTKPAGRADVVIGPYKRFSYLHGCVQICHYILRADRVVRPYKALYDCAGVPANLRLRPARAG